MRSAGLQLRRMTLRSQFFVPEFMAKISENADGHISRGSLIFGSPRSRQNARLYRCNGTSSFRSRSPSASRSAPPIEGARLERLCR